MDISLKVESEEIVRDFVNSGEFANAEEVVGWALKLMPQQGRPPHFEPGELDRLLAEADASGPGVPYEKWRTEFMAMRDEFLAHRAKDLNASA